MEKSVEILLKEKKLKVTQARKLILDCFSCRHKPLNAEAVIAKIKGNKIDIATVYRTLESFEKKGIVKRVDLRKDSIFYELADHHHHHIICKSCGLIEDFEMCTIEKQLNAIVAKSTKFKNISDHSLELFGVCNKCAK